MEYLALVFFTISLCEAVFLLYYWHDAGFWETAYEQTKIALQSAQMTVSWTADEYKKILEEHDSLKKTVAELQERQRNLLVQNDELETSHQIFLGVHDALQEDYNKAKSLVADLLNKKKVVKNGKSIKRKKA